MNIAVVTNLLSPYRSSFFDLCHEYCVRQGYDFRVYVMSAQKADRAWKYRDFAREYTRLLPGRTLRLHIKRRFNFYLNTGLRSMLREFRPDVIVMAGDYLQPTVIRLTLLAGRYGYSTFFWSESHDDEERSYGKAALALREWMRKKTLGSMDGFWYPGEKALALIDRYKRRGAALIPVPNTVEGSFFGAPASETALRRTREAMPPHGPGQIVMFTPARLIPEKGIVPFMDVLRQQPRDSYLWLIAGDGPLRGEIEAKAAASELNVVLLGPKTPAEVKDLYDAADLFVLPSISDPNPLTCVEALWCGKPLFVSEHCGNHPEALRDGENGAVFSYRDGRAAERLRWILSRDAAWYESAGALSRKIAAERFDQSEIARNAIEKTIKSVKG